ncbi:neuronal acetylcholine receptor subunit alpha-2-like [Pomacea canaliculata]|uniref:neuronal acetylcholine receptor subunit alpha-2-like n=1 Tax=Pomacea canaliculata TaxID=400727 RepID=UPI000D72EE0C|nr:neuronal acetylcholine receptor subunit alpha-2-like [Pomacea canaliculata]
MKICEDKSLVVWVFCQIMLSQVFANVNETTEFAESENGMATSDFTDGFDNPDLNGHLVAEMARLAASIQSRPIVSQKVAPIAQDAAGGSTIHLRLEYSVLSLFGTDEMLQTVKTAMFLKLSWLNPALSWNASEHLNITSLEFPSSVVWVPRVLLLNSVDLVDAVETFGKGLHVDNNGLVTLFMPMFTETVCTMDLTRYPYDQQSCHFVFAVFSPYVRWLVEENNDTQQILKLSDLSTTWTLVKVNAKIQELHKIAIAVITLHVKRKTIFYTVCLVVPMVIISCLNTLVFLVPPESGEKMSFFVSMFVSTSVYISFFTDVMPRGLENVPNVMKLLLGVAIEGMLILLATIFILRRFHQEEKLRNSNSFSSKPVNMGNNRTHPIESSTNNIQDGCKTEGKQEMEEDEDKVEAAFAEGLTGTFTFSSQQLDYACFVVAVCVNSIFLSYLLIDSLWPIISEIP